MKIVILVRAVIDPTPDLVERIAAYTAEDRLEFEAKGSEHLQSVLRREIVSPETLDVKVSILEDEDKGETL